MNDTYVEVLVSRKKNPLVDVSRILMYVLAIVCFLLMFVNGIFLVGVISFACLAYFVFPRFDIEYEYLYLDRELSIDKIMSKEKRAKVMNIDLNKMEIMARSNSHELDSYRARGLKELDYTSGEDGAVVYTVVFESGKDGTVLVDIEPNEEMLRAIKNVFPRKVSDY